MQPIFTLLLFLFSLFYQGSLHLFFNLSIAVDLYAFNSLPASVDLPVRIFPWLLSLLFLFFVAEVVDWFLVLIFLVQR